MTTPWYRPVLFSGMILAVAIPVARAEVIFSNFDADGGFHDQDNTVAASVNSDVVFGEFTATRLAVQFTVTNGTSILDSITLPISEQNATPENVLRIRLTEDAAGFPGATLEVLSENEDIWPQFSNPFSATTTLFSSTHPILLNGATYWIVAEPTSGNPDEEQRSDYRWFHNTSGTSVTILQESEGQLPSDPWTGFSGISSVAFSVEGAVTDTVTVGLIEQFGTSGEDSARAVVVDDTGIYVAGVTSGTLPGQTNAGGTDAFVRKYSLSGDLVWTRQFGSNLDDTATGIGFTPAGVDPPGIFVGGETDGALPGQASAGGTDGFVLRLDLGGNVIWTSQFGTAGNELGSIVLNSPTVFVTGTTTGAFPGHTNAGGLDVFYLQIDADGNQTFVDQFGTSGDDRGLGIDHTLSESPPGFDRVFISGDTSGTFPGETNAGGTDAFLRSYDAGGTVLWTRQFGSALDDSAEGVGTPDGMAGVIVGGTTAGTLPGQTSAGGSDAFLMRYDLNGNVVWTQQFGTPGDESGPVVLNSPAIFVAGATTGAFLGHSNAGGVDTYYRKFDLDGNVIVTTQFGTAGDDQPLGMSASADYSRIFIVGETDGAFEGATNAGMTDAFLVELTTPTEEEASDIPAVSTWGLVAMVLLLLTVGTLVVCRRDRLAYAA